MLKYTPGPWKVSRSYDKSIEILGPDAEVSNDDVDPVEALANARLIAAAPDLFESLQLLVDHIVAGEVQDGDCERGLAALRKAQRG